MGTLKTISRAFGVWVLLLLPCVIFAGRLPAAFVEKKFSVNFNQTELKDALALIIQQGGLTAELDETIAGKVTYEFKNVTMEGALRTLAKDNHLSYEIDQGKVYIDSNAAPPGTAEATSSFGADQGRRGLKVFQIKMRFASAKEVAAKIPKFYKPTESIIVDDSTNSIVFYGGEITYAKVLTFVEAFDQMPLQIMIDSQIVETSKNFAQNIGFRWGEATDTPAVSPTGRGTGFISVPGPSNPSLLGKLLLGTIDGRNLEAQIMAAESTGEAKIISHPKIVTLNNQTATIHSGVTFYIKTLSSTLGSTATGGTSTLTGGIQSVSSGLQLQVQPTIVGDGLVRLQLYVTNSEPDVGSAVDGIPGIVDNSANASIIVSDGKTVSMAGLVKSSINHNESGTPFFSKIPVLGWLFSSHSKADRNSELMIFITPHIISTPEGAHEKTASSDRSK